MDELETWRHNAVEEMRKARTPQYFNTRATHQFDWRTGRCACGITAAQYIAGDDTACVAPSATLATRERRRVSSVEQLPGWEVLTPVGQRVLLEKQAQARLAGSSDLAKRVVNDLVSAGVGEAFAWSSVWRLVMGKPLPDGLVLKGRHKAATVAKGYPLPELPDGYEWKSKGPAFPAAVDGRTAESLEREEVSKRVDKVIEDLGANKIGKGQVDRLGDAVDKAKPRANSDAAVGGIFGKRLAVGGQDIWDQTQEQRNACTHTVDGMYPPDPVSPRPIVDAAPAPDPTDKEPIDWSAINRSFA